MPEERVRLDLSIARGLDYYTGTIYETFLTDLPGIGSVCSGGRYDNLAGLYTKQALPGVGASLGLDRLLAAMEELKLLPKTSRRRPRCWSCSSTPTGWATTSAWPGRCARRASASRSIPRRRSSASSCSTPSSAASALALIAGPDEFAQGVWKVKDLATREETTVPPTAEPSVADGRRRLAR